ncbi:hypothetical protein FYJ25_02360 [Anaerobutyricum soehngenii]|uniref:Uncharacterized protein n=1 Tax=Anaerobutyricum soehngenii TaxID=105843 RepID=A0A6N7Y024_9FIRM|nr:hypothetical protein [Anaerobutyricum soehngenii]
MFSHLYALFVYPFSYIVVLIVTFPVF